MVKTKTANGQDQDSLGKDQDLKKMVLRPVLKPSSLIVTILHCKNILPKSQMLIQYVTLNEMRKFIDSYNLQCLYTASKWLEEDKRHISKIRHFVNKKT